MSAAIETKVAIYTRVSTEDQRNNFSLAAQLELLRKYASDNNFQVYKEYVEEGYTGTSDERPSFQDLLQDARNQRFQLILVYKIDRFYRNTKSLLNLNDELEIIGVRIRSATEPIDTSTFMGKFILSLMGSVAQLERDTFLERSKLGRLRRAREGFYSGTNPTRFGYQYNPETKKLEIHAQEAEVVKHLFSSYLEPDSSILKVTKKLRSLNYRTKGGKPFRSDTVHDILRDPVYIGRWYANRYAKGGKLKPREEWIEVSVPAIVSEAEFLKAQELLQSRRNYSVRNAKYQYLLQGLVKCGDCGCTVSGTADKQVISRNGKTYGPYFKLYYRCTHFVKNLFGKKIQCNLRYMQAEALENVIWQAIDNILQNPHSIKDVLKQEKQVVHDNKHKFEFELTKLGKKLNSLHQAEQRILEAYRQDIINIEQLKGQLKQNEFEKESCKKRESELTFYLSDSYNNSYIQHAIDYLEK